eukprot:4567072-Alexandrium_andersonii.AAC.1
MGLGWRRRPKTRARARSRFATLPNPGHSMSDSSPPWRLLDPQTQDACRPGVVQRLKTQA